MLKAIYSSMMADTIIPVIEIFSSVIQGTPLGIKVPKWLVRRLLQWAQNQNKANGKISGEMLTRLMQNPHTLLLLLCLTHFFLEWVECPHLPSTESLSHYAWCHLHHLMPSWAGFSLSLLLLGLDRSKYHNPRSRLFTDQFWGCSIQEILFISTSFHFQGQTELAICVA